MFLTLEKEKKKPLTMNHMCTAIFKFSFILIFYHAQKALFMMHPLSDSNFR